MRIASVVMGVLAVALLAGCGGSGGSGPSSEPGASGPPATRAPTARLLAMPSEGTAPHHVTFSGSESIDPDGGTLSFIWDFGDGSGADTVAPAHTFTTQGTYTVRLTVRDPEGLSSSAQTEIVVHPAGFQAQVRAALVAGVTLDGDTNSPDDPLRANDTLAAAQPIDPLDRVSGYASAVPSGVAGQRFDVSADLVDVYRVWLFAGQRVQLIVGGDASGDPAHDLDLSLVDAAAEVVDAVRSSAPEEVLEAPSDGEYYLRIEARSGGGIYTLRLYDVGDSSAPEVTAARLSADFVPGEVIVGYQSLGFAPASVSSPAPGADVRPRPTLLRLPEPEEAYAAQSLDPASVAGVDPAASADARAQRKLATLEAVRRYAAAPWAAYAEPNYRYRAAATLSAGALYPNDPKFAPLQWNLDLIRAPQAWASASARVSLSEPAAVVAVLDSGIDVDHPDLAGQVLPGHDFVDDDTDPGPPDAAHGTHVAGIIAAAGDNAEGIAGIAWGARILPLRVLRLVTPASGDPYLSGTTADLVAAVEYAAQLPGATLASAQRADILNLSIAGTSDSTALRQALAAARAAGVIIVAAAGNDPDRSADAYYPAAYPEVVSVAALGPDGQRAWYSSRGATVAVAAPGGNGKLSAPNDSKYIFSTVPGGGYYGYEGTSMAAPHIAGVAALMKILHRGLTPDAFDALLASGEITEDLGSTGRDADYGHGMVLADAAVGAAQRLADGYDLPGSLQIHPEAPTFGYSSDRLGVDIVHLSGSDLRVLGVETSQPWASVQPESVDASGFGTYALRVDRSGLASGTHPLTLQVLGSDGVQRTATFSLGVMAQGRTTPAPHFTLKAFDRSGQPAGHWKVAAGTDETVLYGLPDAQLRFTAFANVDAGSAQPHAGEPCAEYPAGGGYVAARDLTTLALRFDLCQP